MFKHAAADQRAVPHGVTVTYQGHVTPHSTAVELVDRAPKCSRKEQKLLQRIKRILRGLRNEAALDSVMTPKITRALNRLNITLRDFVAQHPELELCTKSDGAEVLSLHSTSNGTHKQEKQVHLALSDVQLVNEDDAYVISYHNDALICSRALLHWLILTLRHKMNQGLLSEIETYAKCQKQLSKLNITLRDFALRYPTKFELSYTKANTEKIVLKEDRLPLMCQIRKLLRAADGNELRLAELEGDNICSTELSRLLIASVREFVGYYPFMFKITKDENGAELVQLKKKTKKANNNNQPGSGAPLPVKPPEPQLHTADSIVNLPQPIVSKEVPLTNAVPSDDSIKWVRTALDAHHARKLLSTVNIVAVDAEYQRDQICLVQVRAGALTLLFDLCDAVHSKDLALCLKELMHNGELVKVFHDSRQDTYNLNKLEIRDIKALVDTQVLYQMNQELKKQPEKRIGLGPLLRLCGFEHALKDQVHGQMDRGQVDWSKRPLPEHLIRYAAADVAHLIPLFEALERERKELTYRLYDTYSTSMLRADRAGANQTYLERAAIKTNEKYQLVFSEDKKPNYHPIGTLSNVTTTDHSAQLVQRQNDKELADLIHTLPEHIRSAVSQLIRAEQKQVVEIIIDYAKPICLRFEDRSERTIEAVVDNLAEFIDSLQAKTQAEFRRDNRMGLEGTLHRISVIKNKDDKPVGLTYRIGRHIQNSCALIEDVIHTIIASQQKAASTPISLLLLGPPGVGKTTLLREISARLSDVLGRTVMIIDTSNEIGGDGDAPHECIGNARRMQVPDHKGQHDVMLEAIKNHNPSVIVIDEIGTAAEVKAAKTIGQRGVQLVATAHGTTLDSLMKNPELVALIGGIQPVFVGDRDAVRKEDGSKEKIILQRAGDPTFNIIIEMHRKHTWRIYTNVSQVIDAKLAKKPYSAELRWIDQSEGQLLAVIETHNSETANHTSLHWLDMYKQH